MIERHDLQREKYKVIVIRLLALVMIMLAPFQLYFDVHGNLSVTVAELVLFATLLMTLVLTGNPIRFLKVPHKLTSMIMLLIGSMFISTLLAQNIAVSLKYSLKWTAFLSAYFVTYWLLKFVLKPADIFAALVLAGSIVSLMSNYIFFLGPQGLQEYLKTSAAALFMDPSTVLYGDANWFRGGGTGGTFFNRNWYAAFLGMVLPYCILRLIYQKAHRFFWGLGFIVLISGLLISMSRSGWLGFIAFFTVWGLLQKRVYWKPILGTFSVIIILTLFLSLFFPTFWTDLFDRTATVLVVDHKVNRILIWNQSLSAWSINPLFGTGVANNPIGSAHSNFLQFAADQGIIGLAVFLIIMLIIVRDMVARLKKAVMGPDYLVGLGLLGAWTWFLVQGLLSTTLFNDKMFMAVAIMMGLTASYLTATDTETDSQENEP
ncbi:O-antigen ligase family protein [bacterium]|nr:O-antigen ligase family protein [bacterium]